MAIIRFAMPVRNDMAQVILDALNAGTGAGTLEFYTATMPATPDVVVTTQTKLGTLTLSDPSGTITNGVLTFLTITQDGSADATGDATWVRLRDSNSVVVTDMDVTDEAGSGAVKINTVHIVAGGPILMNTLAITVG
jgi:hypothetical protein